MRALAWDIPSDEWNSFDLVIIRSCWNYHLKIDEFQQWLDRMEREQVKLFNSARIVRCNLHKHYLKELEMMGVLLPDTIWLQKGEHKNLGQLLHQANWSAAVAKPAISASAFNTFLLSLENAQDHQPKFDEAISAQDMIVQQFIPEIVSEGEWSLMYFGKKFSHAILKRPAPKDFRVQHEHGGTYQNATAPSVAQDEAEKILAMINEPLLYARIDGVLSNGRFLLMELELIEPSLFLDKKPESANAFAAAITTQLQNLNSYASARP